MKKTTTYFVTGIMILLFSCSFAQEKDSFSSKFRAAKMYVNSDFIINKNSSNFVSLLQTFSPSIAWGDEFGDFQEVSIQDFNLSFFDKNKSFRSTIDYSYNKRIGKYNPESKFSFYAGGGVKFGGGVDAYSPVTSTSFKTRNSDIVLDLVFTPRMTVKLGKRTFLDVNIPYSVYTTQRNSYSNENPSISVENRKEVQVKSATFPNQFTVRVGVAIKF